MAPHDSTPPRRLSPRTLLRALLLAFPFCALYIYVDWQLSDPPRPPLSWTHLLVGAGVWLVVAFVLGAVARASERATRNS